MAYYILASNDVMYLNTFYISGYSDDGCTCLLSKNGFHYRGKWQRDNKGFLDTIYRFKTVREAVQCFYKFALKNEYIMYRNKKYVKTTE